MLTLIFPTNFSWKNIHKDKISQKRHWRNAKNLLLHSGHSYLTLCVNRTSKFGKLMSWEEFSVLEAAEDGGVLCPILGCHELADVYWPSITKLCKQEMLEKLNFKARYQTYKNRVVEISVDQVLRPVAFSISDLTCITLHQGERKGEGY